MKGYAAQEQPVLVEVTQARASATQVKVDASTLTDPAAFQQLPAGAEPALRRARPADGDQERYPDLKSNENFLALQSQLEGTENRIAIARRDYNAAVQDYNTTLRVLPTSIWAATFYRSAKPMPLFGATAAAQSAPTRELRHQPCRPAPRQARRRRAVRPPTRRRHDPLARLAAPILGRRSRLRQRPGPWAAPTFPALTGRVVDDAHVLSPQVQADLTAKLAALEQTTSRQLVVVTLPTLHGYDIADYGYQLLRAWGIGQKADNNGALFIVVPSEHKVRIEVGYGLEPDPHRRALERDPAVRRCCPSSALATSPGGVVAGTDATHPAAVRRSLHRREEGRAGGAGCSGRQPMRQGNPIGGIIPLIFLIFIVFRISRGGFGGGMGMLLPLMFLGGGMRGGWGAAADSAAVVSAAAASRGGGGSGGGGGASGGW